MKQFTPLLNFYSEDFGSHYCIGLNYTVRTEKLADLAEKWEAEGKIKFIAGATVGGRIEVK
jgi:hypothetical protein